MRLTAVANRFGGMIIDPNELPENVETFTQQLSASLKAWKEENFKTVWCEIPIQLSHLIPLAVAAKFEFHHAESSYLMLTRRLQPNAFIPPYATHYAGAGGVVINEKNELLVIVENGHVKERPNYYKLPGGALEPGEHLADGVRREVLEETGIKTMFHSLVCFRHWHRYRFGKSDFYFVCRLTPTSTTITLEEAEIAKCEWMAIDNYLNHPDVALFNKRIVLAALHGNGLSLEALEGFNPKEREFFFIDAQKNENLVE